MTEAVKFLRERAGSQFDPEIVKTCLRLLSAKAASGSRAIYDANGQQGGNETPPGQSALFMNIRQSHQELLALYEIVQTMGQSLDVQETMDLVIGKTKRIIDFSTCVLYLRQEDEGYIMAAACVGPHTEVIKGRRLP